MASAPVIRGHVVRGPLRVVEWTRSSKRGTTRLALLNQPTNVTESVWGRTHGNGVEARHRRHTPRCLHGLHSLSRNHSWSGSRQQESPASARPAAGWSGDDRGVWPEGLAAPIGELVRMTTPAGVFFDLDDTIVAFEAVADDSWNRAIAKNAGRLGALAPEAVFRALRASAREYWSDPDRHRRGRLDLNGARRQIVFAGLSALGVSDPLLVECLSADYDSIRNAAVHVFPGALEVLQAFRAEGRALALITNGTKASQRAKIDRFDLGRLFDLILVEEEFGVGKPDPAVYRHALQSLALDPASTVMVGDNWAWDIVGAARVGIAPVWVNREKRPRPAGDPVPGVREVRSVAELPALLGRADL